MAAPMDDGRLRHRFHMFWAGWVGGLTVTAMKRKNPERARPHLRKATDFITLDLSPQTSNIVGLRLHPFKINLKILVLILSRNINSSGDLYKSPPP